MFFVRLCTSSILNFIYITILTFRINVTLNHCAVCTNIQPIFYSLSSTVWRPMQSCMMCPLCNFFACQQCVRMYASGGVVPVWLRVRACAHCPCARARLCVFWVIPVTRLPFFVVWADADIVPPASRALEYAGCLCCPPCLFCFSGTFIQWWTWTLRCY